MTSLVIPDGRGITVRHAGSDDLRLNPHDFADSGLRLTTFMDELRRKIEEQDKSLDRLPKA